MRDTMQHRGPDGCGVWTSKDRRACLGHGRLLILDLSDAAAQPMVDAAGEVAVVFNGEIYNHAVIRRELKDLGVGPWRTDHSDARGDPAFVSNVGHRVSRSVPRHVRHHSVGRQDARAVACAGSTGRGEASRLGATGRRYLLCE